MPIYEYRRPDGTTFEVQQSFREEPLAHDPETGVPVQRVLHAPAVHFKGKGFYNTDYGTRKRQREKAAESEKSAASEKGSAKDNGAVSGGEKAASEGSAGAASSNGSKGAKAAKPVPAAG